MEAKEVFKIKLSPRRLRSKTRAESTRPPSPAPPPPPLPPSLPTIRRSTRKKAPHPIGGISRTVAASHLALPQTPTREQKPTRDLSPTKENLSPTRASALPERVKQSTREKPSTRGRLSTRGKYSTRGRLSTRGKTRTEEKLSTGGGRSSTRENGSPDLDTLLAEPSPSVAYTTLAEVEGKREKSPFVSISGPSARPCRPLPKRKVKGAVDVTSPEVDSLAARIQEFRDATIGQPISGEQVGCALPNEGGQMQSLRADGAGDVHSALTSYEITPANFEVDFAHLYDSLDDNHDSYLESAIFGTFSRDKLLLGYTWKQDDHDAYGAPTTEGPFDDCTSKTLIDVSNALYSELATGTSAVTEEEDPIAFEAAWRMRAKRGVFWCDFFLLDTPHGDLGWQPLDPPEPDVVTEASTATANEIERGELGKAACQDFARDIWGTFSWYDGDEWQPVDAVPGCVDLLGSLFDLPPPYDSESPNSV